MSDDQLGDIIRDAQDHPMSEPAHPVLEATFELLGAVMLHRRQEVARQKAFVAGRRRSLKEIAASAAASLIDLRELKHRAFVEWSKIRFPEGLSLKEIDRRMDALFSFCEPLLTWERYGHRGSPIVGRSGLQLQEAGDRICDFVQAWAVAADRRGHDRKGGSKRKRGGKPPLEISRPLVFQVYQRIQNEHQMKEEHVDTLDRLKADKDFVDQVHDVGLKLNTDLVRNALAFFNQRRKRDATRNKQQTESV
jgi:hypothetical protein